MKKLLCCIFVVIMCVATVFPAFAADEFVPSISYKDSPEVVPVTDENGNEYLGLIRDEDGNIMEYIGDPCLVVTPLAKAQTSTLIPDAAEEMLLFVYGELSNGNMNLPYEKVDASIDPSKMVIRELFDASWLCAEHPDIVAPTGVVVELTFNIGVDADTDVVVMTYKNDEWNPIVSVVNNGDGTVTCVFEDFCPIAFAVPTSEYRDPVITGDTAPDIMVWVAIMAAAAVAIVLLTVFRRKAVK